MWEWLTTPSMSPLYVFLGLILAEVIITVWKLFR